MFIKNARADNAPSTSILNSSFEGEVIRQIELGSLLHQGCDGPLIHTLTKNARIARDALDIGCGAGSWVIEMGRSFPHLRVTGIDRSWRLLEYAQAQAQAYGCQKRTLFQVMDARQPLRFPDQRFDLVHLRFASAFLLRQDWPGVIRECARVLKPGGTLCITEHIQFSFSSHAYALFQNYLQAALQETHHVISDDPLEVIPALRRLVQDHFPLDDPAQAYEHLFPYHAMTSAIEPLRVVVECSLESVRPFVFAHSQHLSAAEYAWMREHILHDLFSPLFAAHWRIGTVWGKKEE